MKISVNNVTREMTPEEEAAWIAEHENHPEFPNGEEEAAKAEAYDILMGVSE